MTFLDLTNILLKRPCWQKSINLVFISPRKWLQLKLIVKTRRLLETNRRDIEKENTYFIFPVTYWIFIVNIITNCSIICRCMVIISCYYKNICTTLYSHHNHLKVSSIIYFYIDLVFFYQQMKPSPVICMYCNGYRYIRKYLL
jgi:hypothetical protein